MLEDRTFIFKSQSDRMKDPKWFGTSMELNESQWVRKDQGWKGNVKTSNITPSNRTIIQDCLRVAGAKNGKEGRT